MDEYRNYEKALGYINNGIKCLEKEGTSESDENFVYLKLKKHYMEKYLQVILYLTLGN